MYWKCERQDVYQVGTIPVMESLLKLPFELRPNLVKIILLTVRHMHQEQAY